jgi:DNA-binding IclR family transcriptional regulator
VTPNEPKARQKSAGTKPRVQSAARTVSIILSIAESRVGLRSKEISQKLKLPRQVTYHLLHTLSATRVIRKNEHQRYVLGLAAMPIAEGFHRQLAPPEYLSPHVRELADVSGETAYASGWVDGEIVVLATARGRSPVQAAEVPHGYSTDAHARASGKLLLAMADRITQENYLAQHGLAARTANTIVSPKRLQAEFERIRKRGYAIDEEEFADGLSCLAVPVEGLGGRMALGISVPSDRFHTNFDRYLKTLRAAARLEEGEQDD